MPILSRASSTKHLSNPPNSPGPVTSNHSTPNLSSPTIESEPNNSNEQHESDDTKLKQLLAVLKKAIGVKDLGAMRLSLPANLITPMGNLEYWSVSNH